MFRPAFFRFAAVLLLLAPALHAQTDMEILRRADTLASYLNTDFSADYTIVQDKPGQSRSTTVARVYRRDSIETYVIVIREPAVNRGQGYLKQENTLWFYDPESRRFNTTSNTGLFQNTNARNSDFTRSTLAEDYRIAGGEQAALGALTCRLLTLEAVNPGVTYQRMKIWISEDGLVRKAEDYSLSGQLLRTSVFGGYYQSGSRFVPKWIRFEEALKGAVINGKFVPERTQISINLDSQGKPQFSFAKVPDATFSKTFLESVH
jgi:hypothetical protein